jgi:hypothetical protein
MKMSALCSEKDILIVNVQDQVINQIIFANFTAKLKTLCCFSVVVQPLKISQMLHTHSVSDVALWV